MLRPTLRIVAPLVVTLMTTLPSLAQTTDVTTLLEEAEESFLDVEYENALDLLLRAESFGPSSDAEMMRLLALRGTILFLQGSAEEARVAFGRLLSYDAEATLSEAHPPRAAEFLEDVRRESARPVSLAHIPPRGFGPSEPMVIEASIQATTRAHTARIFYRLGGEGGYSSTEMVREEGDRFVGTIPATGALGVGGGGEVEYFIMVVAGDERIANSGSPSRPHSFRIRGSSPVPQPSGDRPSIARRWWLWTAIGGAVALALGLGLGLGLSGGDDGPSGSVDVTLGFPAD